MFTALFNFFLSNQLKNRKTLIVAVAGIIPIFIVFLVKLLQPFISSGETSISSFYPNFTFLLYLHFLVPIIALFLGTGVIADEVEDNTLQYLLIRPVPRFLIVFAKYLANIFIGSLVIISSLLVTFAIAALGSSESLELGLSFLIYASGTFILGLSVYSALFTLLGGTLRHPMVIGLLFVFGWEKLITYVPGNAQYLTIMNYLQTLYPVSNSGSLSFLFCEISTMTALLVVSVLLFIFLGIACYLPGFKEYR